MISIGFDPAKRDRTLRERNVDFADAVFVFEGPTYDRPDTRMEYGEARIQTFGLLNGRMVIVVWTPRQDLRHFISMRKCNAREQAEHRHHFEF